MALIILVVSFYFVILCINDAINNTAEIVIDIVAIASHILAQVFCLIGGFIVYLISGRIASSFILHSVMMSISRL